MMQTELHVILLSMCGWATCACAGVVEFENEQRPDFFAVIGGEANVSVVDFTGFADFTPITDQWSHLGVHFSGFVVTSGFDVFLFPNDGWGARGEPDIIVDFDEPMQWIAWDFPGANHVVELYNQDELIYTSGEFGIGGPGQFAGVIADQPFDRARLFNNFSNINAIDDLFFGPVIPVPASLIPLSLMLLGRGRRRA